MAKSENFKPEFDKHADNGCIGTADGQNAYAYIRVSSSDQAEEGRSGLSRQIAHIHEVAVKKNLRIPWELVFADDASGFSFEERPALSKLRTEYRSTDRRANIVVIEELDRLSRQTDWHQGFLLDEMRQNGLQCIGWKDFGSRIERAVMGAIAQDGMEAAKKRMMEGNLHKARSGRVTARTPAYGYKLVDDRGNSGQLAKTRTYYGIQDDEAAIVRTIFDRAVSGQPMRSIAAQLIREGVKPPKKTKDWSATQVRLILKNEVYRGDFFAHRWEHTTVEKVSKDGVTTIPRKRKVERPREDWIQVAVPPIVSRDVWEAANRILDQNKRMARRNAHKPFLLTGIIRCANCGYNYVGTTKKPNGRRKTESRYYRCSTNGIRLLGSNTTRCSSPQIPCYVLDEAVWKVLRDALTEPELLIKSLENDATSERNRERLSYMDYLEQELICKSVEDEKTLKAYYAGAFDEVEFTEQRRRIKAERENLALQIKQLQQQIVTPEQLEQRKATIVTLATKIRDGDLSFEPPFELKQRLVKLVVEHVILNAHDGIIEIQGALNGLLSIVNTPALVAITAIRCAPAPARQT